MHERLAESSHMIVFTEWSVKAMHRIAKGPCFRAVSDKAVASEKLQWSDIMEICEGTQATWA